ncbi:type II toxin-antitoxin system RelE/ParE family toxin [Enterococcus casseliflavus]|uniref:type II toxin-antitoxin system RelE/ParE family toxin n=1 Tax=Enterococcus TaxID=1350 RepID=UPI001CD80C91|nr:type II toxin-antitoxin system RelE/ParE family toxin [Enterococcus casseliflavus]MCD5203156.1 type II toxin-antitoxin system RelE/ParE family toxin [Enterococcus casseliflavus]MDV7753779.1 type II toxin-antitoxin system RelE/ParE family toxin [Enterococcus casseliflavus]
MKEYTLVYSQRFQQSLSNLITEWENELLLSQTSIKRFVGAIQKALELTKTFPKMYEEVSKIYGMKTTTYRIVIGKSYALFYRIDDEKKEILVGRIFQSKQMRLDF